MDLSAAKVRLFTALYFRERADRIARELDASTKRDGVGDRASRFIVSQEAENSRQKVRIRTLNLGESASSGTGM